MSETKHTPTPWKWKIHHDEWAELLGADGATVFDDGSAAGEYSQQINPDSADAEFIVLAVNAHDDMLAALECAEIAMCSAAIPCEGERVVMLAGVEIVREAIKKAKGDKE